MKNKMIKIIASIIFALSLNVMPIMADSTSTISPRTGASIICEGFVTHTNSDFGKYTVTVQSIKYYGTEEWENSYYINDKNINSGYSLWYGWVDFFNDDNIAVSTVFVMNSQGIAFDYEDYIFMSCRLEVI